MVFYYYINFAIHNVEEEIIVIGRTFKSKKTEPKRKSYEQELYPLPEFQDKDKQYPQEIIGVLIWATDIGRTDILYEFLSLSHHQACPI